LRGSLGKPTKRNNKRPNTGMKIIASIQAIAAEGLRLAEIKTAATRTISTSAAKSS
jgi:hypothetical protein